MRIEEELKLDYSDVLFRPKRSTLKSRKDVNLLRTYRFKYSKNEWSGIPIMAANMDGVGELSVAEKLNEYGMITSTVNGGTSPYQYLWSTSDQTAGINNLDTGYYYLSVTYYSINCN